MRRFVFCRLNLILTGWQIATSLLAVLLSHVVCQLSLADIVNVNDAVSLQTALNNSVAGDDIVLATGTYAGRFVGMDLNGVTIRSADPMNPAIINAAGVGEGFKLSRVHNLQLLDLVVENASENAINIDDRTGGVVGTSENVSLQRISVRNGSGDAIKLSGVDNFQVNQVNVVGWGGGGTAINMIGSHFGIVERSYIENITPGSGVGIQTKGGSSDIVIRANRLVNANERAIQIGGTTALSVFRPQPPGTVEAANIVAEGNAIIHNGNNNQGIRSGASFINVADGVFRNNIVIRPSLYAFRVLKENNNPGFVDTQNGEIRDNIFVWRQGDLSEVVNTGGSTLPGTFTFDGNQWFNETNPANSQLPLPVTEVNGIYGVDPELELRGVTPWEFDWGTWLVNTSDLEDTVDIDTSVALFLATPGDGSTLDIGATNPLVGPWTFSPVTASNFTVAPFSYAVLVHTVPEPATLMLVCLAVAMLAIHRYIVIK